MTHMIATHAATVDGQASALDMAGWKHRGRIRPTRPDLIEADSVFYSPMANFLELPVAAFHYSVIGGHAKIAMVPGLADRNFSIAELAAPILWADFAGPRAQAGDQ